MKAAPIVNAEYDPFADDLSSAMSFAYQAAAVLRLAAEEVDSGLLHAARHLTDCTTEAAERATSSMALDDCEKFSELLCHPIAVLSATEDAFADNDSVFAARSLLNFSKERADAICGRLMRTLSEA